MCIYICICTYILEYMLCIIYTWNVQWTPHSAHQQSEHWPLSVNRFSKHVNMYVPVLHCTLHLAYAIQNAADDPMPKWVWFGWELVLDTNPSISLSLDTKKNSVQQSKNLFQKNGGCAFQQFRKLSKNQILRYEKYFSRMIPYFLVFFEVFWW